MAIAATTPHLPIQFQLVDGVQAGSPAWDSNFSLGVDGLGLIMVFLATLLTPLIILAGWNDVEDLAEQNPVSQPTGQVRGYFALMLLMLAMTVTVFTALDVFLFYFVSRQY